MNTSTKRVRKYRLKKNIVKKCRLFQSDNENFSIKRETAENLENENIQDHCDHSELGFSEKENSEKNSESSVDFSDNESFFEQDENESAEQWATEEEYEEYDSDASTESEEDLRPADKEEEKEEPEVHELRKWAVESRIPHVHLTSLLKILRSRPLLNVPACSSTFLRTRDAQYSVESLTDMIGANSEFVYLGVKTGLQACVNPSLHSDMTLKLDFNIDGAKIRKSSPKTMWPILCKVYHSSTPLIYKPFAVAIFYGNSKPKDISQFLVKFINEMNELLHVGVEIDFQRFFVEIRTFICDTPARAFIKCIKGHTSFNGCERCDTVAQRIESTIVYLSVGQKRTNEDFRSFKDVNHHIDVSPLIAIEPQIDFIKQFVLDPMHLLYLGITLRLLENWMTGDKNVKISVNQKNELNRRTKMLKVDMPKEFKRKLRPSSEYDKYKAVELRFFTLYCGPIVLKKILSDNLYNHFLLFHVSCRLLSSQNALDFVNTCRQYLQKFVKESINLYGAQFVSLNVHNLNHLADDVENFQSNLNDFSAFPYENELGRIKSILLSPHNTVAQYCRRVHEQREILDMQAKLEKDIIIQRRKQTIKQIKYKQNYFSNKHPDNTALLNNGDIVKVTEIIQSNQRFYLKVSRYKIKKSLYTSPVDSSILKIYEIENKSTSAVVTVPIKSISKKLVHISINFAEGDEKRHFVLPLLH